MSGRVPPSSRYGRKRALRRGESRDVAEAAELYESFSGHEAEEIGRIPLPKVPKVGVAIGTLDGVMYTTVRDGVTEKYIHQFKAKDKPLLVVAPDGTAMFIVGGSYDFTERGIVDGSDWKTRAEMGKY